MIFKSMAPGSAGIGNIPLDNSMKIEEVSVVEQSIEEPEEEVEE